LAKRRNLAQPTSRKTPIGVRGSARLARVLGERAEDARLYRRLATLSTDVPLSEALDDLAFRGVPRARFQAWCDAIGADALRERPTRWSG
jgi:hypothetical protein